MGWENQPCKKCGKSHIIVNRTYWLCQECNHKRLHGESRLESVLKKEKQRKVKIYKLKKKRSKRSLKKPTGEKEMFLEIWEERSHYCVKCGKYLGEDPNVYFFSHIKSKGAFPELRLCKNNIELVCIECHQKYEFGNRDKL